ncbi:RnaseH-domain-containing protein [Pluteus cervinus]|uniref:RnaseH-domain-containing protein n=1 Tax=Pluteus cervinus TaxID=181527 RepID=A0ACD3ADK7_9AGAR|nr:RnaseH-domain-containing protein [Pluteus cervinus]
MEDFVDSFPQPRHRARKNCACQTCKESRQKGCRNPHKCQNAAKKKLGTLQPKWHPGYKDPHFEPPRDLNDDEVWFKPDFKTNTLTDGFRVFTDPTHLSSEVPHVGGCQSRRVTNCVRIYTDGSCLNNGEYNAKAGCGIWYAPNDERNKGLRLPGEEQSNNSAEIGAVLAAISESPIDQDLKIITDSQYVLQGLTRYLESWEDRGWIETANRKLFEATAAKLRQRRGHTIFEKVKGHSGDVGNDGADQKANEGSQKEQPDELDMEVPKELTITGAKLSSMTQSTLYKGIVNREIKAERQKTKTNLDLVRWAVVDRMNILPTDEAIWKSIRSKDISRNIRSFMWRAIHGSYKCGSYWSHIPGYEDRAICQQCNTTETMAHILTECQASGQDTIWKLAQHLLEAKNIDWWSPTIGGLLGSGLTNLRNDEGKRLTGHERLYRIVMTESMHLIWKLRCEWRISEDSNRQRQHTVTEIENRWMWTINSRLRTDITLTNRKVYGNKSMSPKQVKATWRGVLEKEGDLAEGWASSTGVLVGIGVRRPPGRNR